MPTQIIADHREARSPAVAALRQQASVELALQHLAVGDYLLDGRLLFERKTLLDLAASLQDGRLFDQAARLAAAPLHKAIILEGSGRDLAASGMRREALQGALVRIGLFYGIPLLRAADGAESARLMLYAARQCDAIVQKTATPRLYPGKRPTSKHKAQLQVLQALPGIGPSSANNLLQQFGSVEAILNADEQALTGVTGIGAGRAKTIRWVVSEPVANYRCQ